jgi:hypothetical protein
VARCLEQLFIWLERETPAEELPSITSSGEDDEAWSPPPTVWTWGPGTPFETIRFAAVNHLCVELDYQGSTRLIEPYSLRRTRDGYFPLHALRADTGSIAPIGWTGSPARTRPDSRSGHATRWSLPRANRSLHHPCHHVRPPRDMGV